METHYRIFLQDESIMNIFKKYKNIKTSRTIVRRCLYAYLVDDDNANYNSNWFIETLV